MISNYVVSNFKAIGEPTKFDLRPITLVFGANSAGKSSLLHSFLLLKHIVEGGSPDVHRTSMGGEVVDLGGRLQYAHLGRADIETTWSFRENDQPGRERIRIPTPSTAGIQTTVYVETLPVLGDPDGTLWHTRGVRLADAAGDILQYERWKLTLFPHPITNQMVHELTEAMREGDDREPYTTKQSSVLPILSRILTERVSDPFEQFDSDADTGRRHELELLLTAHRVSSDFCDTLRNAHDFFLNRLDNPLSALTYMIDLWLNFEPTDDYSDEIVEAAKAFDEYWQGVEDPSPVSVFEYGPIADAAHNAFRNRSMDLVLGKLARETHNLIKEALKPAQNVAYLGPLRSLPGTEGIRDAGEESLDSLGASEWRTIVRDPDLREDINEWLGPKRLGSNLRIEAKRLYREDAIRETLYKLSEEDSLRGVLERLATGNKSEVEALIGSMPTESMAIVLHDIVRGRDVNIRNVGVGISQVLPVLVRALGPDSNTLHLIEQPELHLHPALQAELADVFIQGGRGPGGAGPFGDWPDWEKTFIIETHSEHLILRLLRRIRETTEKRVPDGLELTPDDLSVYYADVTNGRTQFFQMEVSKRGDFLTPWPNGFFPERLDELL